jgi:hypothetical protein
LSIDRSQYLDHIDIVERFPHPGEPTVSIDRKLGRALNSLLPKKFDSSPSRLEVWRWGEKTTRGYKEMSP